MTSLPQILTLLSAATVAGIVANHHVREMNKPSPELLAPVVRTAAPAGDLTAEAFLDQIRHEVEARRAARDEAEGVVIGPLGALPALTPTALPAVSQSELDYAARRWHERLEEARRAAALAPKSSRPAGKRRVSEDNPRIKHAMRRPTSKGVRDALRRRGRLGSSTGSIFERSRGFATHGSAFPVTRRVGGSVNGRRLRSLKRGAKSVSTRR